METSAAVLPNVPAASTAGLADSVKMGREQIDRITYLASLASKFEDVDPTMDDLRAITAAWDGSSPLSVADERKLNDLEGRLKHYLITSDPLRTFTAESLNQRLEGRMHKGKLHLATRSVIVILLSSLAAAGLSYLPFLPLSTENRSYLAIPLFFVALSIGISWLYLTTLKNFNERVRKAFRLISIGVILFGLAFSHYAAISAFNLDKYPIFQYVGVTWLVALPYFFIYFGIRLYARQLDIQSWALRLPIVGGIWIVLMALTIILLPASAQDQNKFIAYFQNTGGMCLPYFALLGVVLARKIRKVVTPAYAWPMTWMYIYLAFNFVTSVISNIPFPLNPDGSGEGVSLYTLMVAFGVPDHLLLLMTGYSFKKELSK